MFFLFYLFIWFVSHVHPCRVVTEKKRSHRKLKFRYLLFWCQISKVKVARLHEAQTQKRYNWWTDAVVTLSDAPRSIAGFRGSAHITWSQTLFNSCQFPLVSSSRANQVQTKGHRLPSSSWNCASILVWSAELRCWHEIFGRQLPTNLMSVRGVLSQLVNYHLPLLAQSCETVFQTTICFIIDSVSAKTNNTIISAVISGHHYV